MPKGFGRMCKRDSTQARACTMTHRTGPRGSLRDRPAPWRHAGRGGLRGCLPARCLPVRALRVLRYGAPEMKGNGIVCSAGTRCRLPATHQGQNCLGRVLTSRTLNPAVSGRTCV